MSNVNTKYVVEVRVQARCAVSTCYICTGSLSYNVETNDEEAVEDEIELIQDLVVPATFSIKDEFFQRRSYTRIWLKGDFIIEHIDQTPQQKRHLQYKSASKPSQKSRDFAEYMSLPAEPEPEPVPLFRSPIIEAVAPPPAKYKIGDKVIVRNQVYDGQTGKIQSQLCNRQGKWVYTVGVKLGALSFPFPLDLYEAELEGVLS